MGVPAHRYREARCAGRWTTPVPGQSVESVGYPLDPLDHPCALENQRDDTRSGWRDIMPNDRMRYRLRTSAMTFGAQHDT